MTRIYFQVRLVSSNPTLPWKEGFCFHPNFENIQFSLTTYRISLKWKRGPFRSSASFCFICIKPSNNHCVNHTLAALHLGSAIIPSTSLGISTLSSSLLKLDWSYVLSLLWLALQSVIIIWISHHFFYAFAYIYFFSTLLMDSPFTGMGSPFPSMKEEDQECSCGWINSEMSIRCLCGVSIKQ